MFEIPEKVARYTMICVRTIWRFLYIDDLKLSIQTCRLRKQNFVSNVFFRSLEFFHKIDNYVSPRAITEYFKTFSRSLKSFLKLCPKFRIMKLIHKNIEKGLGGSITLIPVRFFSLMSNKITKK